MTYVVSENMLFKLRNELASQRRKSSMRLFSKKRRAVKNWHARALMIDPKKTKLTIIRTHEAKQLPSWVYRKYAPQQLSTKLK